MLSILATMDGSAESAAVVPALDKIATEGNARVQLLTVVGRPAPTRRRSSITRSPTAPAGGVPGAPAGALGMRRSVDSDLTESDEQAIGRVIDDARQKLEEAAQHLRNRGIEVQTEVVMAEDPAAGIIDHAREGAFDLVAMATHGRSGISQLVQGSVASSVVRAGVAPVLLVRPTKI